MQLRPLLALLTGCTDSRALKAYVRCARTNLFNPGGCKRTILMDRILFIAASIALPFLTRPRFTTGKTNDYMLIEGSGNSDHIKTYSFFVKENSGIDANSYHWRQGLSLRSIGDLNLFLVTWMTLILLSMKALFMKANLPMKPLLKFYIYLLQVRIYRPKKVFIFDFSQQENYLLTLALPKWTKVFYTPSNSRLLDYMKYGYFENIRLVLTSPPQLDELKYYINRGWVKLVNTKIEHWSHLFLAHSVQFSRKNVCDLGFFSSGEWARRDGLFQTYDIQRIKESIKVDNKYWKPSEDIIMFLVNYARCHNLKLKIFLHPFEKYLIKQFGIYPPFANFVDDKNIFISTDYNSCSSNFFEAKVGVITTSSILYDRLQFNLETYYYSFKPERRSGLRPIYYHKKRLPTFADYAFENLDELSNKLDTRFNVDSARLYSNQPLRGDA